MEAVFFCPKHFAMMGISPKPLWACHPNPNPLSIALQASLIRRHQSASSLSPLLDMGLRSQHSLPLKGRQGREAAIEAAFHTPHHGSMLALPGSPVPMRGMVLARSASSVDVKQEGPGSGAATATAAGAVSSPRLMQVGTARS